MDSYDKKEQDFGFISGFMTVPDSINSTLMQHSIHYIRQPEHFPGFEVKGKSM